MLFLSDGCATGTEEMHKATLDNIGFGFGEVRSSQHCTECKITRTHDNLGFIQSLEEEFER